MGCSDNDGRRDCCQKKKGYKRASKMFAVPRSTLKDYTAPQKK